MNVENQVAFERVRSQDIETGWRLEAEQEFTVCQLVNARKLDIHHRPQHRRQRGAEVTSEILMQRLKRADLLFAHSFRTFEVVGCDFPLRL